MLAQINHMAMISPQWPILGRFYEAVFGLKTSGKVSRPMNGMTVGDGVVGLNINPLRDGYVGGLDHFGFGVDNVHHPHMLRSPLCRMDGNVTPAGRS